MKILYGVPLRKTGQTVLRTKYIMEEEVPGDEKQSKVNQERI